MTNTPINTFGTVASPEQPAAEPIKLTDIFVGTAGLSFQVVGTREEVIQKWRTGRIGKLEDEYLSFAAMGRDGKAYDLTVQYHNLTLVGGEHDYTGPLSEPIGIHAANPEELNDILRKLGVPDPSSAKSEL